MSDAWNPPDPPRESRHREPGYLPAPAQPAAPTGPGAGGAGPYSGPPGGSYGAPSGPGGPGGPVAPGAPYAWPYPPGAFGPAGRAAPSGVRAPVWVLIVLALAVFGAGGLVGGLIGGAIGDAIASERQARDRVSGSAETYGAGGDVLSFALGVGQCGEGDIEGALVTPEQAVSCTGPHRYEVYVASDAPVAADVPVDQDDLEAFADEACYVAFEPYVGAAYADSDLGYTALAPGPSAWRAGERRVYCLLTDYGGGELEGPARGSGR